MGARCFMVEQVKDCWVEGGGKRVGAMVWRNHLYPHGQPPGGVQPCCHPNPHLGVMTAAGLVCLDCPASDPPHGHWARTGEPPDVTVTPSLNVNHDEWHGFLTAGELTP